MRGWHLFILIALIAALPTAISVKITSLKVPREATHEAPLDCQYDLDGSLLYDVKWYKDGMQFFRCLANGSVQAYPARGFSIYHDHLVRTGTCPLNLYFMTSDSGGEYKCEVTVEGPPFHTTMRSARMQFIQVSRRVQNDTAKPRGDSVSKGSTSSIRNPSIHLLATVSLLTLFTVHIL